MNGLAVVHSYHGLLLLSEKGNKLSIYAATFMNLQVIMLRGKGQSQKVKYCAIPFYNIVENDRITGWQKYRDYVNDHQDLGGYGRICMAIKGQQEGSLWC